MASPLNRAFFRGTGHKVAHSLHPQCDDGRTAPTRDGVGARRWRVAQCVGRKTHDDRSAHGTGERRGTRAIGSPQLPAGVIPATGALRGRINTWREKKLLQSRIFCLESTLVYLMWLIMDNQLLAKFDGIQPETTAVDSF